MSKTIFQATGTWLTDTFLNAINGIDANTGLIFDGQNLDGHQPKIDLAANVQGYLPWSNMDRYNSSISVGAQATYFDCSNLPGTISVYGSGVTLVSGAIKRCMVCRTNQNVHLEMAWEITVTGTPTDLSQVYITGMNPILYPASYYVDNVDAIKFPGISQAYGVTQFSTVSGWFTANNAMQWSTNSNNGTEIPWAFQGGATQATLLSFSIDYQGA